MTEGETDTWGRYSRYLRTSPELSIAWTDCATGARAWLVINSLRGGAAGGGTRMRAGLDQGEVVHLAKAMELKFALAGPPIGGAKSGIDFDPRDPRKAEVLERWYRAIEPELRHRYGTAGDLNVDEVLEVAPILRRLGIRHPQQGVVEGHLHADRPRFEALIERLDRGAGVALYGRFGLPGVRLFVADVITGYGVAESVREWYALQDRSLEGVRVALEGFGNVGGAAALYLARHGARVTSVMDAEKALVAPGGLTRDDVETLVRRRAHGLLPESDPRIVRGAGVDRVLAGGADVFVCAAQSESVDAGTLDRLEAAGIGVIACGSNHPFREARLGGTDTQRAADARFAVLPDVVANCGRARAFGYLMEPDARVDDVAIFDAVSRTIRDALADVHERTDGRGRGLLAATLDLLLDRVRA
ncbi:MAG: Glu/Leu/Phe/Val dehydrogenase dimerization domain-containing protein [Longimicrobiales bacterium]